MHDIDSFDNSFHICPVNIVDCKLLLTIRLRIGLTNRNEDGAIGFHTYNEPMDAAFQQLQDYDDEEDCVDIYSNKINQSSPPDS